MNQIEAGDLPNPLWEMNYELSNENCKHPLPGDWIFGGATDEDPRADPRWQPATYTFLNRTLRVVTMSQVPHCDHEAIGSYRRLLDGRHAAENRVHFILAAYPGVEKAVNIYANMDGVASAA